MSVIPPKKYNPPYILAHQLCFRAFAFIRAPLSSRIMRTIGTLSYKSILLSSCSWDLFSYPCLGRIPLYKFWSLSGDWFFSHGRTNKKKLTKKGHHMTLCMTWARITTQKIPRFFRGGIKVPLYSHTMSLVEIPLQLYFQNNVIGVHGWSLHTSIFRTFLMSHRQF